MKRTFVLGLVAGSAVTVIAACLVAAAAQDKPGFVAREVGRYQIQQSGTSAVWLVDTATGQVWYGGLNIEWSNKGTPVPAK